MKQQGIMPATPMSAFSQLALLATILWSKRLWLLRATGIGFVVALVLAYMIPTEYKSTASIMPPDSQSISDIAMAASLTGVTIPASALGAASVGNILGAKTPGAIFIGILQSRTAQDDMINRFDLRKVYHSKLYVQARKGLAARTAIEEQKSGIIDVTVTDTSPARAQEIARAYVAELNQLLMQSSTSSAHREREFLEDRLKSAKLDLDTANKNLAQFSSKNSTLDIANEGQALLASAGRLQEELVKAKAELAGLQAEYSPENTKVKAVQARVAKLTEALRAAGGGGSGSANLDSEGEQLYPSIRSMPLLGVTYADLFREMKIRADVFETLTKQYELARVEEAKEVPTVKLLDAPDLPERKSFPPHVLFGIVGAFLTFILGAGWLILSARWDEVDQSHPAKLLVNDARASASLWISRFAKRNRHSNIPVSTK